MRLLKTLAIVTLSLLVLAAGAFWYLAETFDSDRVKAELSQAVAERYGRALDFDGPLTLSFWPRLALDAQQVRLSARDAPDRLAAQMQRVRVNVGLLPLLSRQVDVQEIRFDGLRLYLTRDVIKTLESLDGLRDAATLKARKVAFNVRRVTVTDGALEIVDPIHGTTLQLSRLTAFVGPVGNNVRGALGVEGAATVVGAAHAAGRFRMTTGFDIDRAGVVSLNAAGLDFTGEAGGYQQVSLAISSGGVVADADGRWQGRELALQMTGKGRAGTSEITADAAAWQWQDGLHLPQAAASFKRDGARGGALAARVANLRPDAEGWQADSLSVEGNLRRDGRSHAVAVQAVPLWRGETAQLQLNGLDASFGWPSADAGPARRLQLTGQLAWQPLAGALDAELAFNDGAHRLAGAVRIAPEQTPPLQFDLHTPQLSLAGYRAELLGLWQAASLPAFAGRVRADRLEVGGVAVESLVLPMASDGQSLRVGPLDGAVATGRVSGSVSHDGAGAGELQAKLTALPIEHWPAAAAALPGLDGALDGDVRLRFDARAHDPWPTATGTAQLVLNGGHWQGMDVLGAWRAQDAALAAAWPAADASPDLSIRRASAAVQLAGGVAQVEALSIRSDWVQLSGAGRVSLADGALALALHAELAEAPKGMRARVFRTLRGKTVPLELAGTLSAPQWRPAAGAAAAVP
ncbi:MAG: AsmA family protein [Proteobacteria bacterium]|nr:MAG: AsmA family protein [Pseudomonadota bacterium]